MRMVSHGCFGGERGFTIKMSEHPSILLPSSHSASLLGVSRRFSASGISCTPTKSLTFHNRRLMNGFLKMLG